MAAAMVKQESRPLRRRFAFHSLFCSQLGASE
jgi:hypothetical protein